MNLSDALKVVPSETWPAAFGSDGAKRMESASPAELEEVWAGVSGPSIKFISDLSWPLFRLRCVADWKRAMEQIKLSPGGLVVEVASGASDPVPTAVALLQGSSGRYVSANLNRNLTDGLRKALGRLPIEWRVVEDDAANLPRYLPAESAELVAFHHAVNDAVQTIIFEKEGLDTVDVNWGDVLPEMVRLTAAYWADGRLQTEVRAEFLELLRACCEVLKPGGTMAFTHHMYQSDIDLGYPMDLYSGFIPLTREWVKNSSLPLAEFRLEGYDSDWWLFVRKQVE